ncbi:hypothetical protein H5410_014487 [Solanum commersonii]|uniref:Uncharacterized protein n=1 Tax=Solanum commersonii TaxID=4109 RepID=A0A9J5ZRL2_SOLCO|nr:hypothetical protein H5410_014487 [Solanum commersonii]
MTEKKISQKLTFSGRFDRVDRLMGHFSAAQSRSLTNRMGGARGAAMERSLGRLISGKWKIVEVIFGEDERGGVVVLACPNQWSFGDITMMWSSIGRRILTMLAMYNLRLPEFDDVCYVQSPIASGWRSLSDICYVQPPIGGV